MRKHLVAALACMFVTHPSWCPEEEPSSEFEKELYSWSRTFAEALNALRTKYYVKDLNPQDAMLKAINGLLNLDPHSILLDPKAYQTIMRSVKGEFYGIGVVISNKNPDDEFLVVIDVIADGPSAKAGVKAGDRIIEIEGSSLRRMSTDEATAKLKGERNSSVTITVQRKNYPEPLKFTITRDIVKNQDSTCFYLPDQNIYYLSLNNFSQNAVQQIEGLLKKTHASKAKGIILDLRNNSGGLLSAAVDIAGLFLPKGSPVVVTKDRNNTVLEKHITTREPLAKTTVPIIILVNNYTASAAEILSGCLKVHAQKLADAAGDKAQKNLMAFVVGTQTFGKGSVQEVIPASNDCAFKLTTALYFLPDGNTIQGVGVKPDIEVQQKYPPSEQMEWVTKFYGHESALKNYIDPHGKQHKDPHKKEAEKKKEEKTLQQKRMEAMAKDYQIQSSINLINMLHLGAQLAPQKVDNRNKALNFLRNNFASETSVKLQEVSV